MEGLAGLLQALEPVADLAPGTALAALAVFVRVGAVVALLPGFGEQTLSLRLRLAASLALTAIVAPLVWPATLPDPGDIHGMAGLLLAESVAGLALGILMRLTVMALQLAGSIAAQSVAVAQIFGTGLTPDPMPAIGNILVVGGIALAMAAGLHVKAAAMIALSYEAVPFGRVPEAGQLAEWGVAHGAAAFGLAVALAAPYLLISLLYNVALGAINRAMPQLMVAFVGAPFITGLALVVLMLSLPAMLAIWQGALEDRLSDPWEMPR
jgi:flagellar biosynthesis protein FliR